MFDLAVRVGIARPLLAVALLGVSTTLALSACDRAPPAEGLPEWRPSDHEKPEGTGPNAQGARGDGGNAPALVEITWRQQCATCHGPNGHGDGPQGPMFKATDLSRDEWQDKAKDEDIARAITAGKGRMPKFELPDDVVRGLVTKVRSLRGR